MKGRVEAFQDVNQGTLENVVRKIFSSEKDIRGNARKDAVISNPSTGSVLELDIWLPNQRISFEFQDSYHYVTTWYSQIPLESIHYKDRLKRETIHSKGDTLVSVPCWWDGNEASLVATITFMRPDLSLEGSFDTLPIPLNPSRYFFSRGGVPGVGELMNASFPVDGKFLKEISAKAPWWMGEKYDGVRICWNTKHQTVYTRAGLAVDLPSSFTSFFPPAFLDGEFWFGRGSFPDAQRIIKSELSAVAWQFCRITAFDNPAPDFQQDPFEHRYSLLLNGVPSNHPFIVVAVRVFCISKKHLKKTLKYIISDGGEGVILRKPKSIYEHGRTPNLMKLKASRGDREGIVVSVDARKAVTLKLPDGVTFTVSPQNMKQELKPKAGDIVTFSYEDFSRNATPVNPNIYRIRTDISWKDVVRNFEEEAAFVEQMAETKFTAKPYGFWSAEKGKNARIFFEKFAKSKGFDPLVPETWYSVLWQDIRMSKEGKSISRLLQGGLASTLVKLFPDIGLDSSKFEVVRNNWESLKSRRKWFDHFAKLRGFDPLVPSNWYKIKLDSILTIKGGANILEYYSRSPVKAIVHAYPEIGLDENRFRAVYKSYWQSRENRKNFFVKFAQSSNFDPYIPTNWYSRSFRELTAHKGASRVLAYYEGSYTKALLDLFPNIGLDPTKFQSKYWRSILARKEWFKSFAAKIGIDPNVAEDWYRAEDEIKQNSEAHAILRRYDGSIYKALSSLFPNIGLRKDQFNLVHIAMKDARRQSRTYSKS